MGMKIKEKVTSSYDSAKIIFYIRCNMFGRWVILKGTSFRREVSNINGLKFGAKQNDKNTLI